MSKEFVAFTVLLLGVFGLVNPRVCFGVMVAASLVFLVVERFFIA